MSSICHSQAWNSREARGQVSQYPGFSKSFSPTYYSSSFCLILPHSSKTVHMDCSFPMTGVHSIHSPAWNSFTSPSPRADTSVLQGFQNKMCLSFAIIMQKQQQKKIQADNLPPAFQPEAKATAAKLAVCIRKHSNVIILIYLIFNFENYVKTKPKPNKIQLDFSWQANCWTGQKSYFTHYKREALQTLQLVQFRIKDILQLYKWEYFGKERCF